MKSRFWGLSIVVALLAAVLLPGGVALAGQPPLPFSATVIDLTASGGATTVRQVGNRIVIRTVGETTSSTLDCGADPVCLGAGLHGAPLTSTHNSTVRLTPTGPGTFSVDGSLDGVLNIGGVIQGPFQASITGIAVCVPVGPNPCGTFYIAVTDDGNWNAPAVQSHGTLNLSVAGVVGVGLAGGGTLSGTIHLP